MLDQMMNRVLRASQGGKTNITGFNIRDLRASIRKPHNDPWAKADAWRYQGVFGTWSRWRNTLPGLGTATVLFAAYCTYEHFFMQDEHHHGHDEGAKH